MSDWYLGQLARQDANWPEPLPPPELSPHERAAQKIQNQYQNVSNRAGTSNMEAVANALIPQEPWEYGLMAAAPGLGLVGRGLTQLPKVVRAGALAAGIGTTATEAEAGPGKIIKKAGDVIKGFAPGDVLSPTYANPRLRAKAEALQGKYAHYGEDYPPTGPPELMAKPSDPNKPGAFLTKGGNPVPYANMEEALAKDATPGFFLEKKLLPEVVQFQKDRATILKDMEENGYERFFDPKKRFDVDPKHYGPFDDTGTATAPKTAKTDKEWYERYGSPEARARLQEGYRKGQTVEGSPDWYLMGQLEKKYVEEFGAKEGRARFKAEFADMMAATTGGQSPYNNMLMQQYANVMAKRGERLPERSYELPFPIGGRFAAGNIEQAQKYIDEGQKGFEAAVNPKRYDFSSAYTGNRNAFVMDEQMMNAIEPGVNIPQWYGPATRVGREEAVKAGVDPRGFQDVGWAGLKANKEEAASAKRGKPTPFEYEGPMIEHINRTIELTHRLTGKPREEVFKRGVLRKEIPTYTVGGLALGELASQGDYRR